MDEFWFSNSVQGCRCVEENTHYLEIFNYSDESQNSCEEHPLTLDEFDNFLNRKGAFAPPKLPDGVKLNSGMRLIIQKNAKDPDTFTPSCISLPHRMYDSMVRTMRLPFRGIETGSLVGPFFSCEFDQDYKNPHLQMIFRKSDVRKKGKTRGWELMLSHSFKTKTTTGYVKGTPSSDIVVSLQTLHKCCNEVGHPMLLPIIILANDMSFKSDIRQRDARDWLRRLENAISMRDEIELSEVYKDFDVDGINRDLVECHSQVLWKRPQAYQEIIKEFKSALDKFKKGITIPDNPQSLRDKPNSHDDDQRWIDFPLRASHESMYTRLDFFRVKLTGMEHYIHTTLERLHIQRSALYNIMAQKESKLNLEMAAQQRRLAHASKRDSTAMKTLSLLGAIFLPGTFLSSVFSMAFFEFDFEGRATVSADLWIYFAITIPLTLAIVVSWWWMDRHREKRYAVEDSDIEQGIQKMENDILVVMRKKTMSKASTWNSNAAAAVSAAATAVGGGGTPLKRD